MTELISKDSVLDALRSGIPDAEWLLRQIESEQGWLRFPAYLSNVITNLKLENYPLLYASESAIAAMLLRGWMNDEEIKQFNAEIEAATPKERGNLVTEWGRNAGEAIEQFEIPKTPEQQAKALRIFESLSPEEQKESIRVAQHFFCFFFTSFYQSLSVMVHGEKLTSLVAQAKTGNDDAFVKAVQIDKRILTADPYFRSRFDRAQNEPGTDFFDALSYRLRTAPYRGKIRHKTLWYAFSILDQTQLLDTLSHRELLEMCDEAGVGGYDNRIQSVKHLSSRLAEFRQFQKRGVIATD